MLELKLEKRCLILRTNYFLALFALAITCNTQFCSEKHNTVRYQIKHVDSYRGIRSVNSLYVEYSAYTSRKDATDHNFALLFTCIWWQVFTVKLLQRCRVGNILYTVCTALLTVLFVRLLHFLWITIYFYMLNTG